MLSIAIKQRIIFRNLFFVFLFSIAIKSSAQLTYLGADLGYSFLTINNQDVLDKTTLHQANLTFSGMYRFKRSIGIGAKIQTFAYQSNSFAFSDNYGGITKDNDIGVDYKIRQNISPVIFARIYFDTEANYYIEGRINFLKYVEEFSYDGRPNGSSLVINDKTEHSPSSYGFSFGLTPHINDHLFISYSINVDMVDFGNPNGFNYQINQTSFFQTNQSSFESQVKGSKTIVSFFIGTGYVF